MDGLTQAKYEHSTVSELQGPRVNLTFRWFSQHTTSCPLAGVLGCALPSGAQGLSVPLLPFCGAGGMETGHVLVGGPAFGNRDWFPLDTWVDFFNRGGVSAMAKACSVWSAVPFPGVVHGGLGKGVGDHQDAVDHRDTFFTSFSKEWRIKHNFCKIYGLFELLIASIIARVPTHRAFWGRVGKWQSTSETRQLPFSFLVFFVG